MDKVAAPAPFYSFVYSAVLTRTTWAVGSPAILNSGIWFLHSELSGAYVPSYAFVELPVRSPKAATPKSPLLPVMQHCVTHAQTSARPPGWRELDIGGPGATIGGDDRGPDKSEFRNQKPEFGIAGDGVGPGCVLVVSS
jgi:hypothetical protein